jgi:hypothetical protein
MEEPTNEKYDKEKGCAGCQGGHEFLDCPREYIFNEDTPQFLMERTPSYRNIFLTQQTPTKENKSPANNVSKGAIGKTIHVNDATKRVIAKMIVRHQ